MVVKKDTKGKTIDYYEEKIYGCLEQLEEENGRVKVIDEKFVKKFKTYLDKIFKDYEIDLNDNICTVIADGYEIDIGLDE